MEAACARVVLMDYASWTGRADGSGVSVLLSRVEPGAAICTCSEPIPAAARRLGRSSRLVSFGMRPMRAHARGVWMWGDGEAGITITCVARCFCAVPVTSPASERASRVLARHATISPAAVISRRRHRSLDRTAGPGCVIAPTQHPARVSGLGRRRRRGRGAARSVARPVTVWCERPWTSLWRRG